MTLSAIAAASAVTGGIAPAVPLTIESGSGAAVVVVVVVGAGVGFTKINKEKVIVKKILGIAIQS